MGNIYRAKRMIELLLNSQPLPDKYMQVVNDNFWELIGE